MSDEVDHIRQSVCLSLPALCRRIESPDYRRSFAIKAVIVLTESGEDVRCAALEMLGEVIYIFEKDPRDDVARDEETDWDVVASFNVSRP